jgi:exosortase
MPRQPSASQPEPRNRVPEVLALALMGLLCAQLCLTLAPTWLNGEYYAYGWFVPVLAAGLGWRRWRMLDAPRPNADGLGVPLLALGLLAIVLIMLLRWVTAVDPGWRPPVLLQTLVTCVVCHGLLVRLYGWRVSLGMLPVTIFALSAVPYPWQIEQQLIRSLTGLVATLTRELFLLTGKPVELAGERLLLGHESVGIGDGCSGIRSLQSLVMVALFFGELLLLSWPRRIALLAIGGGCAVVLNMARAFTLASIQFSRGSEAMDAAHDPVGHAAFGISALVLFLGAWWFAQPGGPAARKVVRRTRVAANHPDPAVHPSMDGPAAD